MQRALLGLMMHLEEKGSMGIVDSFLTHAEVTILRIKEVKLIDPIVRLYTIVCFYKRFLHRIRKFCCDILFYMENLAVPCIQTMLSCWLDILPNAEEAPRAASKFFFNFNS